MGPAGSSDPNLYLEVLERLAVAANPEPWIASSQTGDPGPSLLTFPSAAKALRSSDALQTAVKGVRGELVTGEPMELQELLLAPGETLHPPHRHRHVEFVLVRTGTVAFTCDGVTRILGPDGAGFAPSDQMHELTNAGNVPANCILFALGKR